MNVKITAFDVKKARDVFEANESRDLFYRAATELVDLALKRATRLSVAEALAVLLQTWVSAKYRYRKFDALHFEQIEKLFHDYHGCLAEYRARSIDSVTAMEREAVSTLFEQFEGILGPVGAAKTLHLLAPRFFPLWDRSIATAYRLSLQKAGSNGDRYWRFMLITKQQYSELVRQETDFENPLKSIDEYNYCKFTKHWLS